MLRSMRVTNDARCDFKVTVLICKERITSPISVGRTKYSRFMSNTYLQKKRWRLECTNYRFTVF
jgi:hypothetical protein